MRNQFKIIIFAITFLAIDLCGGERDISSLTTKTLRETISNLSITTLEKELEQLNEKLIEISKPAADRLEKILKTKSDEWFKTHEELSVEQLAEWGSEAEKNDLLLPLIMRDLEPQTDPIAERITLIEKELDRRIHKAALKPQENPVTIEQLQQLTEAERKRAIIVPEQPTLRSLISEYLIGEILPSQRQELREEIAQEQPAAPTEPQEEVISEDDPRFIWREDY